ncbi:MAG: phosphoribosylglycinamide synthetase C domain-containing protein [Candidatus Aenigmatarchaeota archaeon]
MPNKKRTKRKGLKFLIVDAEGLMSDMARQLKGEGNEVRMHITQKKWQDIAGGIAEKVDDWKAHKDWADVILFSYCGFGKEQEELRGKGCKVVGGSSLEVIETDRHEGVRMLERIGIKPIPSAEFESFKKAREFIRQNPARYVFKPCGVMEDDKESTFVGRENDGSDVLHALNKFEKIWKGKACFMLQRFVEGIEVGVACYFNGKNWVKPVHINFEHKKLMPGEIGPNTGEQGTVFYFVDDCPLFDMTLNKMTEILREKNHVGIVDLSMIINEKGIHPLEFCIRNGYPALQIEAASLDIPWGKFYSGLSDGKDARFKVRKPFSVGVVVSVPPYPYESRELFEKISAGQAILVKEKEKFVRYADVKIKNGSLVPAGDMGYLLVCVGIGNTLEQAINDAYDTVGKVDAKDMMYRNDIGKKVVEGKWIDKLRKWKYL